MTAPFPSESLAGGKVYAQRAELIYRLYADIARTVNDIAAVDAAVNLHKVARLAFQYTPALVAETENKAAFKAAVQVRMSQGGLEWESQAAMVADIVAIRDACIAFRAWVVANLPEALTPATVTYSEQSQTFQVVDATLDRSHAVVAEVQKIRGLFA